MFDGEYCRVHIRVRAETQLGEVVAIGGNVFSLGFFDKSKVVELVTTPDCYPVWYTAKPLVIPRQKVVQYKYCIVENGVCPGFEKIKEPRTFIPDKTDTLVEDVFDLKSVPTPVDYELDSGILSELNALNKQKNSGSTKEPNQKDLVPGKLVIVCYHLPLVVKRKDSNNNFEVTWGESLISKSEESIADYTEVCWVGTLTVPGAAPTLEEQECLTSILKEMNCIPVFLPVDITISAYKGYCKQVMWPLFHNVDPVDHIHAAWKLDLATGLMKDLHSPDHTVWNLDNAEKWWSAYKRVNEACAEQVYSQISSQDTVWVHDYHLMLTPKLLREKGCGNSIVFFLHIPFPTSQIFRSLHSAPELLQSMTCADVIGFHAFDFGRHFLQATKRMLGYRSYTRPGGLLAITIGSREAIVTMSHVSVEPGKLKRAVESEEARDIANQLKEKYRGQSLVLCIDVGQRLSGGALVMQGVDKLLSGFENMSKRVTLIQRSQLTGARVEDETMTSSEMKRMTEDLNLKYGTAAGDIVVDYQESSTLTLNQRAGLYLAADVFVVTSIREGLNLCPLEYIYSRQHLTDAGVVVASEFSACCSLLNGALKINPFNAQQVADTIGKAVVMDVEEKSRRRLRDLPFISSNPSAQWTRHILTELWQLKKNADKKEMIQLPKSLLSHPQHCLREAYRAAGESQVLKKASRVFIFDYGGTVIAKERIDIYHKQTLSAISGRRPTDQMMRAIEKLCADPQNAVLVLTGLTRSKMGNLFSASSLSNLTVATSIGLVYSWGERMMTEDEKEEKREREKGGGRMKSGFEEFNIGNEDSGERLWQCLDFDIDWERVREVATPIISRFTARTNGTCQSPRIPGMGWSYFGADPDYGEKQAAQLTAELEASLAMFDVKVMSLIQSSIEIVPRQLNKGLFVQRFLDRALSQRGGQLPSLGVVVGDDTSDDYMIQAYTNMICSAPPVSWSSSLSSPSLFSIVVGRKESAADYYVNEVKDLEELLTSLTSITS